MFAFDVDHHVVGVGHQAHDFGDVGADAFLQLEAFGDGVGDAGDLGETDDAATGNVAHRHFHIVHQGDVMLAVGKYFYILHHHHVALGGFEGLFKFFGNVRIGHRVVGELLGHHVGEALRRLHEAFPRRVVAHSLDDEPRGLFQFLQIHNYTPLLSGSQMIL